MLVFWMLGASNANESVVADHEEALSALNAEVELFKSLEELVEEQVIIVDGQGNQVATYSVDSVIKNELGIREEKTLLDADLMFEYQGDLFYLKG